MNENLTFRDKVVLTIRDMASLAPKLGLVKKPKHNRDGITFIIPVKDEERWIKPCIQSIQDTANEIIIIDSSVEDNTTKIVESLAATNPKIKHIKFYYNGYNAIALSLHIGVVNASYKWIFRWDGDMVAKSPETLQEWVDKLKHLDQNRYYAIDVSRINLKGDLEHQDRSESFWFNGVRIYTWNPELHTVIKKNACELIVGNSIWGLRLPPYYKLLRWDEPYIFHCDIKNPKRLVLHDYWIDYMTQKEERFKNLEEYTIYRLQKDKGITMEEAIKEKKDWIIKDTIPYDKAKFGELPEVLKNS